MVMTPWYEDAVPFNMAAEIGSILEGKVTGITNFGAFVELPDKSTGMVHISEVSSTFIKDIHEKVSVGVRKG